MRKTMGMNKHQKAVYRKGEEQVSRETVVELLEMARSADPDDRFTAASYLCPCHVKGRIPEVWNALYRMMEDPEYRVRHAAWHTLEDGGVPTDPETFTMLQGILNRETHPKIRRFAESILHKELAERAKKEKALLTLAAKAPVKKRGKCDFCGESNVFVDFQLDTMIPEGNSTRAALICEQCVQTY